MAAEAVSTMSICARECDCCIDRIYSSIKTQANGWKEMDEKKFTETPLHRAAAAGNTAVAVEILNLMPSLGRKLNGDGQSPLHLAIEAGHRHTARTLAEFDNQLVRVKGKGGLTPLMQSAAVAGDDAGLELLASLLVACPEAVADVNNRHETVVHVALEHRNCRAVCVLVDWLRRRGQTSSVLSVEDFKGNTVLHAAAQFGCVEGAKKLVDIVKLNRLNSEKKTALDVAMQRQNEVEEVLKSKGARPSSETPPSKTMIDYVLAEATFPEAISRTYYYLTRELTLDLRGAILVVAALIVAATYQGVLQPPGGVYPPPDNFSPVNKGAGMMMRHNYNHMRRHGVGVQEVQGQEQNVTTGLMVMEKKHYRYFMPSNTFAFALSTVIMIFVVPGTPVFLILHSCLVFMCVSYLLALDAISPYPDISNMIYGLALYAIVGAFFVKLLYYPIKALLVEEDWWLRQFSVKFDNFWSKFDPNYSNVVAAMKITHSMKMQHQVLDLK